MTGRGQREGVVAEFLRDVLAGRALGVPKLEAMARTAGLLGGGDAAGELRSDGSLPCAEWRVGGPRYP